MFPHISTKAMEIEKGEKPKGGVNKWLNGLPVMYRWLRLKTLGSHLRNQEECASVLSHQWKRKKTRKTLGFGEILEVPGVLVVQEEALRQSRKNQDLVGKAVYVPDISSTATGGESVDWEVMGLSITVLQSISYHQILTSISLNTIWIFPHFLCIVSV